MVNGQSLTTMMTTSWRTRYGIWWPWYGQFEVGWLQPLELWLGAGTSSVAPVLVSQDIDLCHVQLHPTWFEPTSECRSWPVVSYLYNGHLPVGLYLGRGSLLLVGLLFSFPSMPRWLGTQQKRTQLVNVTSCVCTENTLQCQNISTYISGAYTSPYFILVGEKLNASLLDHWVSRLSYSGCVGRRYSFSLP